MAEIVPKKLKKKRKQPTEDVGNDDDDDDQDEEMARMQQLARTMKLQQNNKTKKKAKVVQQQQQAAASVKAPPSVLLASSSSTSLASASSTIKSIPKAPPGRNLVWKAQGLGLSSKGGINPNDPIERARREERAKRFTSSGSDLSASASSSWLEENEPVSASGGLVRLEAVDGDYRTAKAIIGTCEVIEKDYIRTLDRVNPATVRPLRILRLALDRVKAHWKANEDYTYACSQLKSIRQDLVMQHIEKPFTVEAYEVHARIALEAGDLNEFVLCCSRLDELRAKGLPTKADEFTAYRLLHALYHNNFKVIRSTFLHASPQVQQSDNVRHAMEVIKSHATGNHHRYFSLYQSAPDMSAYLMDFLLFRVRRAAIERFIAAYGPMTRLSLSYLAQELSFDDIEECQSFIEKVGGVVKIIREEGGERGGGRAVAVALLDIGASRKRLAALQEEAALSR